MLDVLDLSFDYQDKPVLNKVQFSLAAGQLMHLRGANGAGKTTLLKLLAGLLQPNEGLIRYEGEAIYNVLNTYQRKLCYVGHRAGLNPLLTVRENCYFDMHWGRRPLSFESLLEGFGLRGLADEPCYHLSAGQRRRVGLLRIAMTDASLWLLDEPLVALDAEAISTLMNCLVNHVEQGGQVILTSHQSLPFRQPYLEFSL
ncbi:Cytochrome c biogenesis ATP-binding export protein CcmA [Legionella massiliensis]|uniref:Cytochrome c biogenesis ATP-binding export protein CcmA n=1 Tax=Legionella massiliensis TaxID=1034943 RepID=A0A078L4B2_9GAMM|nr:cytochrome c biogenesis heme-transporting ATPase CcmA [Legionella massiliensis]CDZ78914.1 Cytochrome c biogenesis ATP-binding export protein CcmA [Legionella massiliensis]CEE14652.1 Cytochrome c biogenesis ATP-binding export protein CcmA [Legionella massiliensis]